MRAAVGGGLLIAPLGPRVAELATVARESPRPLAIQSIFTCIVPWLLIAVAMRSLDASLAAILNSLSPIFIFLITALITHHEPVTARKGVGVGLGIAGVLVIVGIDALAGFGAQTVGELLAV